MKQKKKIRFKAKRKITEQKIVQKIKFKTSKVIY